MSGIRVPTVIVHFFSCYLFHHNFFLISDISLAEVSLARESRSAARTTQEQVSRPRPTRSTRTSEQGSLFTTLEIWIKDFLSRGLVWYSNCPDRSDKRTLYFSNHHLNMKHQASIFQIKMLGKFVRNWKELKWNHRYETSMQNFAKYPFAKPVKFCTYSGDLNTGPWNNWIIWITDF